MWNVERISTLCIYTYEESKLAANGIKSIKSLISGMRKKKSWKYISIFKFMKMMKK